MAWNPDSFPFPGLESKTTNTWKIVENQTPRPIDFQENHWKINSPSPWIFKKLMENQYPCPLISIKTLENHWPHPIDFQAECGKSIPQPIDFHHESFEASYVLVGGWLAACLAGNQNLAELSFGRWLAGWLAGWLAKT